MLGAARRECALQRASILAILRQRLAAAHTSRRDSPVAALTSPPDDARSAAEGARRKARPALERASEMSGMGIPEGPRDVADPRLLLLEHLLCHHAARLLGYLREGHAFRVQPSLQRPDTRSQTFGDELDLRKAAAGRQHHGDHLAYQPSDVTIGRFAC